MSLSVEIMNPIIIIGEEINDKEFWLDINKHRIYSDKFQVNMLVYCIIDGGRLLVSLECRFQELPRKEVFVWKIYERIKAMYITWAELIQFCILMVAVATYFRKK